MLKNFKNKLEKYIDEEDVLSILAKQIPESKMFDNSYIFSALLSFFLYPFSTGQSDGSYSSILIYNNLFS